MNGEVLEMTMMCAERGWKATFYLSNGTTIASVFITGTDWDAKFVSVEKVGERHKPPQLINLADVQRVEPHWN